MGSLSAGYRVLRGRGQAPPSRQPFPRRLCAGYEPDAATVELAKAAGISSVSVTSDRNAVKGADVIYTDVWASMGQKDTLEKKMRDFAPYQARRPPSPLPPGEPAARGVRHSAA